ncbi:hypothetical protein GC097_05815 [Paenibacillus sp. LMG 31457]|uniref:Glycinamide ribonucleotide synthetase n=1 Tax=Paenibacillus planticolens TaxID=2654976 RepID=A0ABX1ZHL7_9BACL|nr:hypothetical protein [Paenibacillus planticolens]
MNWEGALNQKRRFHSRSERERNRDGKEGEPFKGGCMKWQIVTNGGRVLGITGIGKDIVEARQKAYADADRIHFGGKHYRTDIAMKAFLRERAVFFVICRRVEVTYLSRLGYICLYFYTHTRWPGGRR